MTVLVRPRLQRGTPLRSRVTRRGLCHPLLQCVDRVLVSDESCRSRPAGEGGRRRSCARAQDQGRSGSESESELGGEGAWLAGGRHACRILPFLRSSQMLTPLLSADVLVVLRLRLACMRVTCCVRCAVCCALCVVLRCVSCCARCVLCCLCLCRVAWAAVVDVPSVVALTSSSPSTASSTTHGRPKTSTGRLDSGTRPDQPPAWAAAVWVRATVPDCRLANVAPTRRRQPLTIGGPLHAVVTRLNKPLLREGSFFLFRGVSCLRTANTGGGTDEKNDLDRAGFANRRRTLSQGEVLLLVCVHGLGFHIQHPCRSAGSLICCDVTDATCPRTTRRPPLISHSS